MLFPAEQDWEGTQNLWNFRYDCPAAYKENLQTLHDNQQKAAGSNIKVLEDAIGALLQKNPAKSLHRYTGKNSQGEQDASKLSTDFGDISNDIALSLPDGIPIEVREAFDCACAEATKDVPGISCPTLKSSKTQLDSPNPLRKDLDTVFQALDKGSSDCHAPQASIDGAIQPQP
jgi:hypothetical protein